MYEDVIIAGFGGQGIMLMGQLLAYAGLKEAMNVLWMPAYGPETRGGFANCTVIFSNEEIGSPVVSHPHSMIIMNLPSMDKFEHNLIQGGLLVYNSSLIEREPHRKDVKTIKIPAVEIAHELGNAKAANMVALGAYLGATGVVKPESVRQSLEKVFPGKEQVVALNVKALEKGIELSKKTVKI